MADRTLLCKDCGNEFIFSEGEQKFFLDKGVTDDPIRCPECRKIKKEQRNKFRNTKKY